LMNRGCENMVAVYYNRKIAHMLAGGLPILLSPIVFDDPIWPLVGGILGCIALASTHLLDRRLWWMQTEQNMNDATFAFMLGISVYFLWNYSNEPWLAILPALFMAFGDGVTGIIRNFMFRKRTKSAWGNLGMAIVCLPLGFFIGGSVTPSIPLWGLLSGAVASFIERYEFGPIDDNVLIVVASTIVLLFGLNIGPI
jgi:phytol kinase